MHQKPHVNKCDLSQQRHLSNRENSVKLNKNSKKTSHDIRLTASEEVFLERNANIAIFIKESKPWEIKNKITNNQVCIIFYLPSIEIRRIV